MAGITLHRRRIRQEDMFRCARIAGLQPRDMGKLMNVSRVTASLWFNNHSQPHRLLVARARKILAAVDAAVSAGDFPLAAQVTRTERDLYVKQVVIRHLKQLACDPVR